MSIKDKNTDEIKAKSNLQYIGMMLANRKIGLGELGIKTKEDAEALCDKIRDKAIELNDNAGLDRLEGAIVYLDQAVKTITGK